MTPTQEENLFLIFAFVGVPCATLIAVGVLIGWYIWA